MLYEFTLKIKDDQNTSNLDLGLGKGVLGIFQFEIPESEHAILTAARITTAEKKIIEEYLTIEHKTIEPDETLCNTKK